MHNINLLIANSNNRVTNLIYSLVRAVGGENASVHCCTATRVDDFLAQAVRDNFDLIIINPEDLCAALERRRRNICINQAADAIRSIKTLKAAPIICVAVSPENELLLSEAGADLVLGLPFNCEDLKSAVGRLLIVPDEQVEATAVKQSFASSCLRGWERLTESFSGSKP